jgi:hypothetical protein
MARHGIAAGYVAWRYSNLAARLVTVSKEGLEIQVVEYVTPSGKAGSITVNKDVQVESKQDGPPRYRFGFEEDSG